MNGLQDPVETLNIQMFGGFMVSRGDMVLTDASRRSRRLWLLMKYLLVYRDRRVSVNSLVEALWGEEECLYPERALQNLVYRLRLLLGGGERGEDYILQSQGAYYWNNQANCCIDMEQFERTAEMADRAYRRKEETAESLYRAAVSYYQGELLPDCGYEEWILAPRNRYKELYLRSVKRLTELLQQSQQLETVVQVCTEAARFEPYEESLYAAKIDALVDMGKIAQARTEYENISQLLYRDLGVKPSPALEKAFQRIRGGGGSVQMDVDTIERMISGNDVELGAYYCSPEAFTAIYRVEMRRLPRSNMSLYLLTFSLLSPRYEQLEEGALNRAMEILLECVRNGLRRSDVVARWNDSQIVILLHSLTYEDGRMIIARLRDRFQKSYSGERLVLRSSLRAMEPAQPQEDTFGGN